ncbi:MAG TPA: hypothetical protein DCE31_09850, partial [Lautropia sp.]|nr:hypothetical protein [Lautropia sp.]
WVAGDMMIADHVLEPYIASHSALAHWLAPAFCAVAVVVVGKWLDKRALAARRAAQEEAASQLDLVGVSDANRTDSNRAGS